MAYKPSEFPQYTRLPCDVMNTKIREFLSLFVYIAEEMGIDHTKIDVSKNTLQDIIERVEKRRVYFHVYHNIEMGELNEVALVCFWTVKLMPFHDSTNPQHVVNIPFALWLFTWTLTRVAEDLGTRANITELVVKHLCYAFIYQDISKEALMRIAEALIIGYNEL